MVEGPEPDAPVRLSEVERLLGLEPGQLDDALWACKQFEANYRTWSVGKYRQFLDTVVGTHKLEQAIAKGARSVVRMRPKAA